MRFTPLPLLSSPLYRRPCSVPACPRLASREAPEAVRGGLELELELQALLSLTHSLVPRSLSHSRSWKRPPSVCELDSSPSVPFLLLLLLLQLASAECPGASPAGTQLEHASCSSIFPAPISPKFLSRSRSSSHACTRKRRAQRGRTSRRAIRRTTPTIALFREELRATSPEWRGEARSLLFAAARTFAHDCLFNLRTTHEWNESYPHSFADYVFLIPIADNNF